MLRNLTVGLAVVLGIGLVGSPCDAHVHPVAAAATDTRASTSSLEKGRTLLRAAVRVAGRQYSSGDSQARFQAAKLYRQAIPLLMKGAIENPNDPSALGSLATAYAGAGDAKGQMTTLAFAVDKFPNDGGLLLMLGSALLAEGDYRGAQLVAERLNEVDPARASSLRAMARMRR